MGGGNGKDGGSRPKKPAGPRRAATAAPSTTATRATPTPPPGAAAQAAAPPSSSSRRRAPPAAARGPRRPRAHVGRRGAALDRARSDAAYLDACRTRSCAASCGTSRASTRAPPSPPRARASGSCRQTRATSRPTARAASARGACSSGPRLAGASRRREKGLRPLRCPTWGPTASRLLARGAGTWCWEGRAGHLAVVEWGKVHLTCELQVKESVRDVCFLHQRAVLRRRPAQARLHLRQARGRAPPPGRARRAARPAVPAAPLFAGVGERRRRWARSSTKMCPRGRSPRSTSTRLGRRVVLTHNPHNAVLVAGHSNGTVTMWSPNQSTALVRMLVHRGPVRAAACDASGRFLVTAGADRRVKVWDVRTYAPLHTYLADTAPTSVDISQRGLLAVAMGAKVQVWPRGALEEKAGAPQLSHLLPTGSAKSARFCPYEDVLACGTAGGFSTMLVPGSGEPNFDSWVVNPLASLRERRAQEVAQLLDKLQPDSIALSPGGAGGVGALAREPAAVAAERAAEAAAANAARARESRERADGKKRMKGKNKPTRRQHRKQTNVVEDRKPAVGNAMRREQERKAEAATARERGA